MIDRMLLSGVSFRLEDGRVRANLTNIRKLAAVTPSVGLRWRAIGAGDPPRHSLCRSVWHVTWPETPNCLALHDMNRAGDDRRGRVLDQVGREMEAL